MQTPLRSLGKAAGQALHQPDAVADRERPSRGRDGDCYDNEGGGDSQKPDHAPNLGGFGDDPSRNRERANLMG